MFLDSIGSVPSHGFTCQPVIMSTTLARIKLVAFYTNMSNRRIGAGIYKQDKLDDQSIITKSVDEATQNMQYMPG